MENVIIIDNNVKLSYIEIYLVFIKIFVIIFYSFN